MDVSALICPVCSAKLDLAERTVRCSAGHAFDLAKEGYVNLLRSQRSGDRIGDDKLSARSRRDFLNKGYYAPLRDALVARFQNKRGMLIDICCGEGYYTSALSQNTGMSVYGFDISREMVRLAAKRGGATCFVANMASIPVSDDTFDYATHLFAPFQETEFCRILKPGGSLYTVIPGSHHLFGLKQVLYDRPYLNDEKLPQCHELELVSTSKISAEICLSCQEDIDAVFRMTPYYFRTSAMDKQKLFAINSLVTSIEFIIAEYRKSR